MFKLPKNITMKKLVDLFVEKYTHNLLMLIFYETSFTFPSGKAEAYKGVRIKATPVVINCFHETLHITFYYRHCMYVVYAEYEFVF